MYDNFKKIIFSMSCLYIVKCTILCYRDAQ